MEHVDALREMSVEKYLLGELSGAQRELFEEHLFECSLCAADLKSGVTFAEAVRVELPAMDAQKVRTPEKTGSWFDWLLRPQWMAPALAACLLTIGYQNFFRLPALQQQLARAEAPHIATNLSMPSGEVRGGGPLQVVAAPESSYVLSPDLPPQTGYAEYVCSLYSQAGALVWKQSVPPAAAGEEDVGGHPPHRVG